MEEVAHVFVAITKIIETKRKSSDRPHMKGHSQVEEKLDPLIRWAGSKRKLLPQIESKLPQSFGTYFEPFFGSGCLFFRIKPSRSVLGDLNHNLISFYRQVRLQPTRVLRSAVRFPRETKGYYNIRNRYVSEKNPTKRASMFLFLNRFCFNGIFRTNAKGIFNVPFGEHTGSFPTQAAFIASAALLKQAELICYDFEITLKSAKKGDFVYLDPPYVYSDRRNRGEYGNGSFDLTDIRRLRKMLLTLHKRGVHFLLSYLSCPEVWSLVDGFEIQEVPVKRCVAGLASARRVVNELLVRNY